MYIMQSIVGDFHTYIQKKKNTAGCVCVCVEGGGGVVGSSECIAKSTKTLKILNIMSSMHTARNLIDQ